MNYGNTVPSDVHAPDSAYGYGFIFSAIVYNGIGYQMYFPTNGEGFYIRFSWGASWADWKKYSSIVE